MLLLKHSYKLTRIKFIIQFKFTYYFVTRNKYVYSFTVLVIRPNIRSYTKIPITVSNNSVYLLHLELIKLSRIYLILN